MALRDNKRQGLSAADFLVVSDARRSTFRRRAPNHAVGIAASLLTLTLCGAVFAFVIATRSATQQEGEVEVEGLSGVALIHRNAYGIPHITAQSENDAYFGIGYAHAQDRLWQMDYLRRVGRGRLAEILGRRLLEHDIFLRAMRFDSLAARLAASLAPESRAALEAYAAGVNAYIATRDGKFAAEFDALGYAPEPWSVEDCLLILRLWAWELSGATFTFDLTLAAIAEIVGKEYAAALLPPVETDAYFAPFVLDSLQPARPAALAAGAEQFPDEFSDEFPSESQTGDSAAAPKNIPLSDSSQARQMQTRIRQTPQESLRRANGALIGIPAMVARAREIAGMNGSSLGSSAWAVRSSDFWRAKDPSRGLRPHGAILAADAHLPFALPARFYEAHISAPTLNALGLTLPGLPFVIAGRNDRAAWSFVYAMIDDVDFFIERVDSADARRYQTFDSSGAPVKAAFRVITDTIKVKDSSDAVIDMRYTARSCVISDLPVGLEGFPGLENAPKWKSSLFNGGIATRIADSALIAAQKAASRSQNGEPLTFRWTGYAQSDESLALARLAKIRTVEDAREALQSFGSPAANVVLAFDDGAVALLPTGFAPKRRERAPVVAPRNHLSATTHPNMLRRGWERADDWAGVFSLQSVGELYNPPSGRVIAANNPIARNSIVDGEPAHLSYLWDVSSRAARISEAMEDFASYSTFGMSLAQTDVASHYAQRITPLLQRAFLAGTTATSEAAARGANPYRLTRTERRALADLAAWNGALESSSASACVYAAFMERFVCNVFSDNLGEPLYRAYAAATRFPLRAILYLAERPASDSVAAFWFDKRHTPEKETRDDIIRQSFIEAVAIAQRQTKAPLPNAASTTSARDADADSLAWRYGRMHTLNLRHILSNGGVWTPIMLNGATNLPPLEYGGDATTVAGGEWLFHQAFEVAAGASMRFVCDMRDTSAYMIVAGGNSGELLTRNYSDQTQIWLNGGLLPVPVARSPHASFRNILRLIPKDR